MNKNNSDTTRLDSWKAIARYLNVHVRTARRWEAQEGLPVHRHLHSSKATVFAYRGEVDSWMASRTEISNETPGAYTAPVLVGMSALLVAVVVGGFWFYRNLTSAELSRLVDNPTVHAVSLAVQPVSRHHYDGGPRISAGLVTWVRNFDSQSEIMLRAYGEERQLTDNDVIDDFPDISGGRVVWQQGEDCYKDPAKLQQDCDIVLFENDRIRYLTRDDRLDKNPRIDGSRVVWSRFDGNDFEVVLFENGEWRTVTNNSFNDVDPSIDGEQFIWSGHDGNDYEIFLHDGERVRRLTDNEVTDSSPAISGSLAAWVREQSGDATLLAWRDGLEVPIPRRKGNQDWAPSISGDLVVWSRDRDIYLYDGAASIRLTDGRARYWLPDIDDGEIVWQNRETDHHGILRARYVGTQEAVSAQ